MIRQINFSQRIIFYAILIGIRPDQLTNLCLTHLTDKILKGFDEGLITGMMLIDLRKAFDTINHEVLLQKLKATRFNKVFSSLGTTFVTKDFLRSSSGFHSGDLICF